MSNLTAEKLREILEYSPSTGVFVWKKKTCLRVVPGTVAGYAGGGVRTRAVQIRIEGALYKAHRLAWLWMTGVWPSDKIDHRDGDPFNNRWDNLRQATSSQNNCNQRRRSDNSSGYKGVHFHRATGQYVAELRLNGKRVYIAYFVTAEAAHEAYCVAAEKYHGEFARVA